MNKKCLGLLAFAVALQSCIDAAPTNTTTSKAPITITKLPASISSETPITTTEAQPTTEKIETTEKSESLTSLFSIADHSAASFLSHHTMLIGMKL